MNEPQPFLADAVVGNSSLLASLSRGGRLLRLWWPNIGFPQHLREWRAGLFIEGGGYDRTVWLDDENAGWHHSISYEERTNIVRTQAASKRIPIEAEHADYAVPGEPLIVREYSLLNRGERPLSFRFVVYSSFIIAESELYNTTRFDYNADALVHFRHRYAFAIGSSVPCAGFQAGDALEKCENGELNGNVIDMKPDGGLMWRFDNVPPGEMVKLPIYICAANSPEQAEETIIRVKRTPAEHWRAQTASYWKRYLDEAEPCPLPDEEYKRLYERSLLVMKLMADEESGSIIAAPEFDEWFSRCGGYAYCWGRDAAFITQAFDRAGLFSLSTAFYDWTLRAQDESGAWQQRHYHDGSLAPSWGIQLDEGGSILWGMWQHYKSTGDQAFAERVWPAVAKGADYLVSRLDSETGLPEASMDLWEERLGQHIYSAAAVYGGLQGAASFAQLKGEVKRALEWSAAAARIRASIINHCWNDEKRSYYRSLQLAVSDEKYRRAQASGLSGAKIVDAKGYATYFVSYDDMADVSLLGLAVPFQVVDPREPRMRETAERVEQRLTVSGTGGLKRYEDDEYIGGNPWILTTLWLAQYRIQSGETEKARPLLQWALEHTTETGLLPEQIDKESGEPAWVVPLTWSHAMFVIAVHMLADVTRRGKLDKK